MSAQLRRRLWWAVGVVIVAVVISSIALLRSRSVGCSLPAPVPDLPAQLKALASFDRPYDLSDERTLEEAAAQSAAALHPDLIGVTAERPVRVAAASADRHDAVVVPLTVSPSSGPRHLAGAVAFLLDCSGGAYFSAVLDVSTNVPPIADFPAVTRDQAVTTLGTGEPKLVYPRSPLHPLWRNQANGREIPASD